MSRIDHDWLDLPRTAGRWLVVAALVCATVGCVQRRLTVRSNPPGALVYIDNKEIGTAPVSTDYIYYGTRRITLVKDGYETLVAKQWIPPPWYQIFPLDFVTENVIPYEFRDERTLEFQMQPQMIAPTDQLLNRAENLRQGSRVPGFTAPQQPAPPTGIAPPPWSPNLSPPPIAVP